MLDSTLLEPRRVLQFEPCRDEYLGYIASLECGHMIWTAAQTASAHLCGACLERLCKQIRDLQSRQRIP